MNEGRYELGLADSEADVRGAQALRWQVFAGEMGARLVTSVPGHDVDRYDPHCDHLLVRLRETGEVVGTYRVLGPTAARRLGGSYMDEEFDMRRFRPLREHMLELGRCCVHADHRRGAVIALLWAGIGDYLRRWPHEFLIGCASVPLDRAAEGEIGAIWHGMRATHLGPPAWRATPRCPLPMAAVTARPGIQPTLPPLLKAYLRAGARLCGAPAWDRDFRTADLPMLLALDQLHPTHARHFLRG